MLKTRSTLMFCGALLASTLAWAEPSVHFVAPVDGATVSNPIQVKMAVDGMKVMPAGEPVVDTGHHHLIIDGQPVPMGEAVPADTTHLHFGKGQTETELSLPPGKHTLTLQFADGKHQSYGPALSQTIEITVK